MPISTAAIGHPGLSIRRGTVLISPHIRSPRPGMF